MSRIIHELEKEASQSRVQGAGSQIDSAIAKAVLVDDIKVVSMRVEVSSIDELKNLGDALRSKLGSGIGILGAVQDGKATFVCVVTDDLLKSRKLQAGKIVGSIAKLVGGGGGGKPHMATAGGKDVHKLDDALGQAAPIVKESLK